MNFKERIQPLRMTPDKPGGSSKENHVEMEKSAAPYGPKNPVPLDASVDEIKFTSMTRRRLQTANILTVEQLVRNTNESLSSIIGVKYVLEVREELRSVGRQLGEIE